jgi:hypothetical protein
MSASWLWLSIFQSGLSLLCYRTSHHTSTSHVFLQQVLSRFGACVECLTDQGSEFRREFQDLLDHALIDHHWTLKDRPQVDGLAKRIVQTCKTRLQNICLIGNKEDWDLALPYITMGYKMSKHTSLSHFSLYFLHFGRHPIPPSSIVAQMDQVVDLDFLATWAKVITGKAALFKKVMPMAMENLSIAQHRDNLWYAHTRGGSYKPKVILCISSGNLMILWTLLPVTLTWGLRQLGLHVCWSYKELTDAQFEITLNFVPPASCRTWILLSSCRLGFLHLTIHVRYVRGQMMLIRSLVEISQNVTNPFTTTCDL